MSVGPEQQSSTNLIEQARQRVNRLVEEIANLSEQQLSPAEYYGEFLQRILTALNAPAGAVWVLTPQGNLQVQYQIKMREVGLDRTQNSRQMHDELLRQAHMRAAPCFFPPQSSSGEKGPGNPTDHFILLAPISYDKQVVGIVEVWQDPMRGPDAQRNYLEFLIRMAALAAGYTRNHQLRQMVGQQQVWVQLEAFARQIHGSLNPLECSYLVVNEGRRLIEADRVSVALRSGQKAQVLAISGADVVEKRSNLVQLMRKLFEEVMHWGERLVYSGSKDDSLPPAVLKALDLYLAESNSKLLVILPLKDERETKNSLPPRSALMMEAFEPAANAEQMLARMEVIGRHATAALYNAAEYRRIPFRFIWLPIAKLQEGVGGKAKAIVYSIGAALFLLLLCMIFVPYPLKMEAHGPLEPKDRQYVYSKQEGYIKAILMPSLKSGDFVAKDTELLLMFDNGLATQMTRLLTDIQIAKSTIDGGKRDANDADSSKRAEAEITLRAKTVELENLIQRTGAKRQNPGEFVVRAPISGILLTPDFRESLPNKYVKPNEPLLQIGRVNPDEKKRQVNEWEVELKIPQKHIGQVLGAYQRLPAGTDLDVDLLFSHKTTQTFKGKLARNKIASQANANRQDPADQEPVVLAWVRLTGDDIAEENQLPPAYLLTGVEVHSRIRCGDRAMGYSLFYGVWEFLYEKVLFFF